MAVRLLPQVASRQLSRSDQQHQLSEFTFLSNEAAEAALAAGGPDAAARALGLLELARAVLQGQALDIGTDLLELHASHPVMASRFLKLRDRLDAPDGPEATAVGSPAGLARGGLLPGPGGTVDVAAQAADRHRAGREFAALLDQIRALEGFASFLLPPRPEDLTRHATYGPIVAFNIGRSRSGRAGPAPPRLRRDARAGAAVAARMVALAGYRAHAPRPDTPVQAKPGRSAGVESPATVGVG